MTPARVSMSWVPPSERRGSRTGQSALTWVVCSAGLGAGGKVFGVINLGVRSLSSEPRTPLASVMTGRVLGAARG